MFEETIVYLLDSSYQTKNLVDNFKSFIWTDRYIGYGDFELYVPASNELASIFHQDDYVWIKESERLMIIEDINLETDAEAGDFLIVSGRSLESILTRRIIWGMTVLTGNFQDGIRTLLERNVISPSNPSRKIPNFRFVPSTDPRIMSLTIEAQYFGENLYDEIEKLCTDRNLGFRVLPADDGGFEFSLYFGEDRSYKQEKNPWIIFSPKYENLVASNYQSSKKDLKNATLVGGEGEGYNRETIEVTSDSSTGLDRREVFTDASGVTKDTSGIESDDSLSESEKNEAIEAVVNNYYEELKQKGSETLASTKITESFDGEIDTTVQFIYNEDFYLGDLVQIVNEYGMEASSRVSEVVISHDENGKTIIPTFTVSTDDGKESE